MRALLPSRALAALRPLGQFADGFLYFFRGLGFLFSHPVLWPLAILPVLLNAVIVLLAAASLVWFFRDIVNGLLDPPASWVGWIFYVAAVAGLVLLAVAILYFLFFMLLPGIVGPPFKGKLTRRTREILKNASVRPAGGFWIDVVLPTIIEVRKAFRFLLVSLALLPLNLVPVAGSVAYLVLFSYFTWMHMALNYLEYPIDSEPWVLPLEMKRRYVRSRRWPALGFGCAMSLTCLVPFLNFFCIPVGVVGATLLYQAYGEQEGLHAGPPPTGRPWLG